MVILGYCGDNCIKCPRYLATVNGSQSELKNVALLWVKIGFRDNTENLEDLKCYGCNSSKFCAYEDIRECCLGKKVDNCGKCPYYECKKISSVFRKTELLAEKCEKLLSKEEFNSLDKAFFQKKANLNKEKMLNGL